MRRWFVVLHRWVGLLSAAFLFCTGVTGAVISWDHELDAWLNPHLTEARASGPALPALELARGIEGRHPTLQVTFVPLAAEPGHALAFGVEPRVDTRVHRLHAANFNQVFVDPASGEELGRRKWGAVWPIARETLVSFLYKLHYSLHLPALWGTDRWGPWLLGVIALVWTADCFVGLYLTLPAGRSARSWWRRWTPSWKVRWRGGSYKLNFDLHRASGLWCWVLLFIIAFTGFSMNLYAEVFYPVMSRVSNVTPSPFDERRPAPVHRPIAPRLQFADVLRKAQTEAQRRGWDRPAGSVFYARDYGIYRVAFFHSADDHGVGGVGHRELFYDGLDGRVLGDRQPWVGTAADIFMQAQFPLHSGRILGLPGRIVVSFMGIVVALLSVTGGIIWWRKRGARVAARARSPSTSRGSAELLPPQLETEQPPRHA